MKREPKKVDRKAKALTNPLPRYISLVTGGANGTPFTAVKMEHPLMRCKSEDQVILSIHFKAANFDEPQARAWLAEGGYVDFVFKASDTGFDVVPAEPEATVGEPWLVELDSGVSIKVAQRQDVPDTVVIEPARPLVEVKSEDGDLQTSAKSLYHFTEVASVMYTLVYIADDLAFENVDPALVAGIKQAAVNLHTLLSRLAQSELDAMSRYLEKHAKKEFDVKSATSNENATAATATAESVKQESSATPVAETTIAEAVAAKSDTVETAVTEATEVTKTDVVEPEAAENVAEAASTSVPLADFVALRDEVTSLGASIRELLTKAEGSRAELVDRVSALEGRKQEKKSAPVEGEADTVAKSSDTDFVNRRRLEGVLGRAR